MIRKPPRLLAKAGNAEIDRPLSVSTTVAGSVGAVGWTVLITGGVGLGLIVAIFMAANKDMAPSGTALAIGAAAGALLGVGLAREAGS